MSSSFLLLLLAQPTMLHQHELDLFAIKLRLDYLIENQGQVRLVSQEVDQINPKYRPA